MRAYGTLANRGTLVPQTTIVSVTDGDGKDVVGTDDTAAEQPVQAIDPGAAGIITDILAGNTDPSQNPFWGQFRVMDGGKRRPATLKTGTNNDARDLNAYGYIGAPNKAERADGEYALAVGAWNGNSDNTLVSTRQRPPVLDRRHDLRLAGLPPGRDQGLEHQRLQPARRPGHGGRGPLDGAAFDGRQARDRAVPPGHRAHGERPPRVALWRGGPRRRRLREATTRTGSTPTAAGSRAPPVAPASAAGREGTRTGVLLRAGVLPLRHDLGPAPGSRRRLREPVAVRLARSMRGRLTRSASVDPLASVVPCPSTSTEPSAEPSESLTPTEPPTEPPTEAPTDPPTAPPTDPPTAPPTDPPTAPPTDPPADQPAPSS